MSDIKPSSDRDKEVPKNDQLVGFEKHLFPLLFSVLGASGIWRMSSVKRPLGVLLWKLYYLLAATSVFVLFFTISAEQLINDQKSWREFFESLFLLLTIFNGMCKIVNVHLRRPRYLRIVSQLLQDSWLDLRYPEETAIVEASKLDERFIIRFNMTLVFFNNVSNAVGPLLDGNPDRELMVDAYTPCRRSASLACYLIFYWYQVFGYNITSFVHIGCDGFFFDTVDRVCAHLKILERRLVKLPELVGAQEFESDEEKMRFEMDYVKECVRYHHSIFEVMRELRGTVHVTIIVQLFSSVIVLCTSTYLLSCQPLFCPEFLQLFIYFNCALFQNFFYFWFGYKITVNTLHVSQALLDMNWWTLHVKTRKMLLFVMMRTSNKVELFNSTIMILTPESFVKLEMLVLALVVVVVLALLYAYSHRRLSYFERAGVPHAAGWFLVGSFKDLCLRRKHLGQAVRDFYNVHPRARYVGAYDLGPRN
uniref:Odorant receptor n=1 Tax=Trichogramma kaykai TaxID=54128 RepID=A0ABD2VYR3_9HYME